MEVSVWAAEPAAAVPAAAPPCREVVRQNLRGAVYGVLSLLRFWAIE